MTGRRPTFLIWLAIIYQNPLPISTCPQGHQAQTPSLTEHTWSFHFPQKVCAVCPLHARCCTGHGGRTVDMNIHYDLTQTARTRQKTEAFKKIITNIAVAWKAAYRRWCEVMDCGLVDTSDRRNATCRPSSLVVLLT